MYSYDWRHVLMRPLLWSASSRHFKNGVDTFPFISWTCSVLLMLPPPFFCFLQAPDQQNKSASLSTVISPVFTEVRARLPVFFSIPTEWKDIFSRSKGWAIFHQPMQRSFLSLFNWQEHIHTIFLAAILFWSMQIIRIKQCVIEYIIQSS